ncbi:MAG: hypothetical protein PUG45_08270 [bacterium]|nr:hypothetical protein [bacterium]
MIEFVAMNRKVNIDLEPGLYNGAGDKSEFGGENMTAHMRLR